jgi:hypothetical protein
VFSKDFHKIAAGGTVRWSSSSSPVPALSSCSLRSPSSPSLHGPQLLSPQPLLFCAIAVLDEMSKRSMLPNTASYANTVYPCLSDKNSFPNSQNKHSIILAAYYYIFLVLAPFHQFLGALESNAGDADKSLGLAQPLKL